MGSSMNIYQFQSEVTISRLESSIGQVGTDSSSMQIEVKEGDLLNYSFMSDPKNETNSSGQYTNPVYKALYTQVIEPMNSGQTGLLSAFGTVLDNFISNPAYQSDLSDALLIQATSILGNSAVWPASGSGESSQASGYLTTLNSVKSSLDALANEEGKMSQTDSSMLQSALGVDTSTPTTINESFTTVLQGANIIVSILQSSAA